MKFLVDTQLPPRLAKFLSSKGFDANHTSRYPEGYFLDDEAIRRIAKTKKEPSSRKTPIFLTAF